MVFHPKTPMLNCYYHLMWLYFLTVSEFSCVAKSYSVSGLTTMRHICRRSQAHVRADSRRCIALVGFEIVCKFEILSSQDSYCI